MIKNVPTLSQKPCQHHVFAWVMTFHYNDHSFDVEIGGEYPEDPEQYKIFLWMEGDRTRFETKTQREFRHENQMLHEPEKEISDDGYDCFPSLEEGIMKKVQDCLDRFKAISYIVNL